MTISRELERAARRMADQQSDRLEEMPTGEDLFLTLTGVSPLTVSWRGADYTVDRRLQGSALNVGDRVLCRLTGNQLILHGKLI